MFSYIKGTLTYKHNSLLVVEAGGIGYKISTPVTTVERCGSIGDEVKIFTYLYVRENLVELIGFLTMEELSMFELLISVSGVGPKAALSISAMMSPTKFSLAVVSNDSKAISKAPGIGLKTAQRLILELKDKMKKQQMSTNEVLDVDDTDDFSGGSKLGEAISALMVLGYSSYEASRSVSAVYNDSMELEDIIKASLRGLMK
ncbi:MAG TPA: Holliday junction branch migration protein RuvA [Clostridia bacterium]|jgi:Holliday junction DNA helicase RuvA|nr:Holliday junction branch migration protein RuvA [Clostridia bacterium]